MTRHCWIDASAGIAGDMLLGALVDAGAPLPVVQQAVDAVIPGGVRLTATRVTRAGLSAVKVDVEVLSPDQPHRAWRTIRDLISDADVSPRINDDATAVFRLLATAEGRVHGVPPEDVEFHEVGALDSIADVVGVCAALHELGVRDISAGPVALGSGTVSTAHGALPVPVPAVTELSIGWHITGGGAGERTTPTGMALLAGLATPGELPPLTVDAVGVGAGTRDPVSQPNVTRVLLGATAQHDTVEQVTLLETNVDDLDPRLWPGILSRMLTTGALDTWLTPILMKKGRPAHTLSVLCRPDLTERIRELIFAETTTLGIRELRLPRHSLPREFAAVTVDGMAIRVKLAVRFGAILQVTPEFDDVAAAADRLARSQLDVLAAANAAAAAAGLVEGAPWPT